MQTISRTGSPSGATDGEDAQDAALEVSLGSEGAEGGENVEDADDGSDGEDGQEEGAVTEGNRKSGRRDRRSRERRRRDRDRRKKEEKRMTENRKEKAAAGASARELIDDAILDKSDDPHEIMEVYQWPMPLPHDAGRIRAVYPLPGQTHEFWASNEDYFAPINEEAVREVLAEQRDANQDDAFRIPRLGPHFSSVKGAIKEGPMTPESDEDLPLKTAFRGSTSGYNPVPSSKRRAELPPSDDDQSCEGRLRTQKMTMRMLAALIQQDGVATASSGTAALDQGISDRAMLEAVSGATASQKMPGAEMLSLKIEQRVRQELTNLGLMERPDIEYDDPALREDDVICAQLRLNQQALRKHMRDREAADFGSLKRLRECIENGFVREKLLSDVLIAAKAVTDPIQPKFKWTKTIKPAEMKKNLDNWDRVYSKYKSNLNNPAKIRKPLNNFGFQAPKRPSKNSKTAQKSKAARTDTAGVMSKGGAVEGGMWAGSSGGSEVEAKSVAAFHQSVHG